MAKHTARWRKLRSELTHSEDLFGWSAQCNVVHHERFFDQLIEALEHAGVTRTEVARRLGIGEDELDDVITGQTDMTLTELRMLTSASELIVDFRVEPAAYERVRMYQRTLEEARDYLYVVEESSTRDTSWSESPTWNHALSAKAGMR